MRTKITGKMRKALLLLVGGMSGKDVSASIGVQESTVSHWLNHCPQFSTELERLRERASSEAIARFSSTVTLATATICQILAAGKSEAVKLKAAEYVINNFGLRKQSMKLDADATKDFGNKVDLSLVLQGLGIRDDN